jgi:hypothetical protein
MKRPTRSMVLPAVFIVLMAIIGTGVWFVVSHRDSVTTSARLAEAEFSELRARFANQQPLIDMSRREPLDGRAATPAAARLRSFHTVVFDTRGGRIVRITVPYWFARRYANRDGEFKWLGELTFLDDTEFDPEPIRLSLDQLERRRPGLVAHYRHPSGGQFISWVE